MPSSRPNVLVLYADQMRYDCTGAAGNPVIRTPHLDRLASEGVFFEQAYTSFPLCCPFRASMMTGKYAHSNGMYANHYPIPLGQRWLADCFNDAGYQTLWVGKWHLNGGAKYDYVPPDYRCGFQRFIGFSRGHQYFNPIFYRDDDPTPRTRDGFEPEVQTEHLLELLTENAQTEAPFLGMVCYGPPHPPLDMPERYERLYDPAQVPVRACTPEPLVDRARRFLSRYYGLCTAVDDQVGRIVHWLEEHGLSQNTLLVFVSDHGDLAGEHGLFGKKTYAEGAMRVPFLIRWPAAIAAAQRPTTLVDPGLDLMPTLLELCGLAIPGQVQGQSLATLVTTGSAEGLREAVFYEILKEAEGPEKFPLAERGLRTRDWLYVRRETGPLALHHLPSDPLEQLNRLDDPNFVPEQRRLDARLARHMRDTEDDWAKEAHFPPPNFMSHEDAPAYHRELLKRVVREG